MPATQPRPEQLARLAQQKPDGDLYMLNLLKFKQRAEYADGRETDLTGEQAYLRYGAEVQKIIEGLGGGLVFGGPAHVLVIGDGELEWDWVAIMRYPSFEHFTQMVQSPEYQAIHVHRDAGLAHQLLINCLDARQALTAARSA